MIFVATGEESYEEIMEKHAERRRELNVIRRGQIVGPAEFVQYLAPMFTKIKCFRSGSAPKTQRKLLELIAARGYQWEVQFDAAHGRRYRLMIFRPADRNAVICFGTYPGEDS